ncbi:MAG: thioredoxin domain-containing protein [Bacteroidota bacterium]
MNSLINETSPYLLQHAHNPVNWYAWNNETLELAKKQNKMMLISIGYSACHWCHVMEREVFENEDLAKIMNENFINIKVDREERPDIDQVYMLAVQLMTGHGGWPLNCFTLPDGRPIYGGTYFPAQKWKNILLNLVDLYNNDATKVFEYATRLTQGIKMSELVETVEEDKALDISVLKEGVEHWKQSFDDENGGPRKAPKFPMPNNYLFLLKWAKLYNDVEVKKHVEFTLTKMAFGGIYDQLEGGFARYSTDISWKVPHFEKMLYDNAQLISLYSFAYQEFKNPVFKEVVYQTIDFVKHNFLNNDKLFYSALDADSEGEEGKFYVWKKEELLSVLKNDFELFSDYYNVNELGFWEHENYILLRNKTDEDFAIKHNLNLEDLKLKVKVWKKLLLAERNKRIKPGLDDKSLTSWNALQIKALTDACLVFNDETFLLQAEQSMQSLLRFCKAPEGNLLHSFKNGKATINAFLEDYAFVIEALNSLFLATGNDLCLQQSQELTEYCFVHFYDEKSGLFYFTSNLDKELISRKFELSDNVIPASASVMATNLFILSKITGSEKYEKAAKKMLLLVIDKFQDYGSAYSNWAVLACYYLFESKEVVISGTDAKQFRNEMYAEYLPNHIIALNQNISNLSLFKHRFDKDKTQIFVCENNSCHAPVLSTKDALKLL